MASDEVGRLLGKIGQILAEDTEYRLDGTFLYAEVGPGVAGSAIYKDLGNQLVGRWPPRELNWALLDLWEAEEPARRWAAMTYVIDGGKFDASFLFADDLDPDEDKLDRQARLLRERFGDKPIDCPPLL